MAAYRNGATSLYPRATTRWIGRGTQNNLGTALRALAGRSDGPQTAAFLDQAVAAYRSALEVRSREQTPQEWASTQTNLGNALRDLAGRSVGPKAAAYLEQSVGAFRSALPESEPKPTFLPNGFER